MATHLFLLSADLGISAVHVRPSGLQDRSCMLVMVPASLIFLSFSQEFSRVQESTPALEQTKVLGVVGSGSQRCCDINGMEVPGGGVYAVDSSVDAFVEAFYFLLAGQTNAKTSVAKRSHQRLNAA